MGLFQVMDKRAKAVIGLDITSSSVKLLELSRDASGYRVESYVVRPLPPGVVSEKNINDISIVAEVIAATVSQAKTRTKAVAVAVPVSTVITKTIEMPATLSERGIEAQLAVEADQYIPYPLDEVSLDFSVLGPSPASAERVSVLLAACRREIVDQRAEVIALAGLHPRVVDVETFAVERACQLLGGPLVERANQVVAVADVGATMLTLSVLVDGKTLYTREQLLGGRQITEQIQRRYGLALDEAEHKKLHGGLPADYPSEILAPFIEGLIQQISRSLQFFFSSSQYNYVDHLVLAGGVAATTGLRGEIEAKLGLPTTIANPLAAMTVARRVNAAALMLNSSAMLVALGLALRSFD